MAGEADPAQRELELGRDAYARKDLATAEAHLALATELKRDIAQAQHLLANVYQDQGKLDRAIGCYRRAIRLAPGFAEAHNDLGTAYFAKGWQREAAECYAEAVRLDPQHDAAHANLGETLMKLGQYKEARKSMRAAVRIRILRFLRRLLSFAGGPR